MKVAMEVFIVCLVAIGSVGTKRSSKSAQLVFLCVLASLKTIIAAGAVGKPAIIKLKPPTYEQKVRRLLRQFCYALEKFNGRELTSLTLTYVNHCVVRILGILSCESVMI